MMNFDDELFREMKNFFYISGNLYLDSKVAGLKGIPVNSVDASVLKRSLKFLDPSDVSEFFDFVFTVVSE